MYDQCDGMDTMTEVDSGIDMKFRSIITTATFAARTASGVGSVLIIAMIFSALFHASALAARTVAATLAPGLPDGIYHACTNERGREVHNHHQDCQQQHRYSVMHEGATFAESYRSDLFSALSAFSLTPDGISGCLTQLAVCCVTQLAFCCLASAV